MVDAEYEKLEEARKMVKAERLAAGLDPETGNPIEQPAPAEEGEGGEGEAAGEEKGETAEKAVTSQSTTDEDKYAEAADMPGVKVDEDSRTKITVRNLRIREDTAKYLYNLDPNSAYYDPKSRSMRENPFEQRGKNPDEVTPHTLHCRR